MWNNAHLVQSCSESVKEVELAASQSGAPTEKSLNNLVTFQFVFTLFSSPILVVGEFEFFCYNLDFQIVVSRELEETFVIY